MEEISKFKEKIQQLIDSPHELYQKAINSGHITMKDIRGLEHEIWKFINKLNS